MPKPKSPSDAPAVLAPLKEPALVRLRVDQIIPNAGNAREHNAEQLRLLQKSLEHFGIVALPIVQKGTNVLIAGHGRVEALKAAGRLSDVIPCLEVELTNEDALAYAVTDNRLTDLSSWNLPMLKAALVEIDNGAFDVELTGFTADALDELFPVDPPDDMGLKAGADPDAEPPLPSPSPFLGTFGSLGATGSFVATQPRLRTSPDSWMGNWPIWSSPIRPTTSTTSPTRPPSRPRARAQSKTTPCPGSSFRNS